MVIVLISTIGYVTGPRFFGQGGFDQQFFRNDILSAVRYAQKLAVATGCQVRVNFSTNSYSLKLQNGNPCTGTIFTTIALCLRYALTATRHDVIARVL